MQYAYAYAVKSIDRAISREELYFFLHVIYKREEKLIHVNKIYLKIPGNIEQNLNSGPVRDTSP